MKQLRGCGPTTCSCNDLLECSCSGGEPEEGVETTERFAVLQIDNWSRCTPGDCLEGDGELLQIGLGGFALSLVDYVGVQGLGFQVSLPNEDRPDLSIEAMFKEACQWGERAPPMAGTASTATVIGHEEVCNVGLQTDQERGDSLYVEGEPGFGMVDGSVWSSIPEEGSRFAADCWARSEFDEATFRVAESIVARVDSPSLEVAGCDTQLSEWAGTTPVTCSGRPDSFAGE